MMGAYDPVTFAAEKTATEDVMKRVGSYRFDTINGSMVKWAAIICPQWADRSQSDLVLCAMATMVGGECSPQRIVADISANYVHYGWFAERLKKLQKGTPISAIEFWRHGHPVPDGYDLTKQIDPGDWIEVRTRNEKFSTGLVLQVEQLRLLIKWPPKEGWPIFLMSDSPPQWWEPDAEFYYWSKTEPYHSSFNSTRRYISAWALQDRAALAAQMVPFITESLMPKEASCATALAGEFLAAHPDEEWDVHEASSAFNAMRREGRRDRPIVGKQIKFG